MEHILPAEHSLPLLSVVVPTFNRRVALARLLGSLAGQSLPPHQFEVVVVDDGSTDDTVAWLGAQSFPYSLRLVAVGHSGPSAARNAGIDAARGARVLFLDDDVMPGPANLAEHVATAAAHGPAETVVIGPLSRPPDVARTPWLRWVDRALERQYRAMLAGEFVPTARQFYTANGSVPCSLLQQVGGFDVTFRRGEDVELAYRLAGAGARFAFAPRADVHHYAEHSFAAWTRTSYQYGRYDVVMERESDHPALRAATHEFHGRQLPTRVLARLVVGRLVLVRVTVRALSDLVLAAERAGAESVAMLALSAIANLVYWQGVADELGGAPAVWERIAAAAPQ